MPVALVSAYTALIAVVSEAVDEPTVQRPEPEQFLTLRWIGLAALVVLAAALTYGAY